MSREIITNGIEKMTSCPIGTVHIVGQGIVVPKDSLNRPIATMETVVKMAEPTFINE